MSKNKKEEKKINFEVTYRDNELWYKIGEDNENNSIIRQINGEMGILYDDGMHFFVPIKLLTSTDNIKYINLMDNGDVKLEYYIYDRLITLTKNEQPNVLRRISVDKLRLIFKHYAPYLDDEEIHFMVPTTSITKIYTNLKNKIYAKYYINKHTTFDMVLLETF